MKPRDSYIYRIIVDLVGFSAAAVLARAMLFVMEQSVRVDWRSPGLETTFWVGLVFFPVVVALFLLFNLYEFGRRSDVTQHLMRSLGVMGLIGVVYVALSLLPMLGGPTGPLAASRRVMLVHLATAGVLLWWLRARWPGIYGRRQFKRNILIVGAHTFALRALQRFAHDHRDEVEIHGYIDDFKTGDFAEHFGLNFLGGKSALENIIQDKKINTLAVLNDQSEYADSVMGLIKKCPNLQEIYVRTQIPLFMAQDIELMFINEVPLLKVFDSHNLTANSVMRDWLDKLLAMVGLVLSAPFFALMPLLIKMDSRGSVFYRQKRLGLNNEPFWIFKFRSMAQDAEKASGAVIASKGDARITRIGRIMRSTRIDELPQLLNVLLGQMSMIGPRPERPEFQNAYLENVPWYPLRSYCKPGITGLAQVHGEYDISTQRKLLYDVSYLANQSVLLDIKILFATVLTVLTKRGH